MLETDPGLQVVAANLAGAGLATVLVGLSALLTSLMLRRKMVGKLHCILEEDG